MQILHTTDLHFNKHWFEWIEKQQDKYDIFCISGDFLDDFKDESLSNQILWITSQMRKFEKPLFICSGNHDIEELDDEDWINKIPNIYSDFSIKTISNITFGCIPYIAPEFHEYDECDVILYHIPPAKSKTSIHKENMADWGDRELFRILKKGLLSPQNIIVWAYALSNKYYR